MKIINKPMLTITNSEQLHWLKNNEINMRDEVKYEEWKLNSNIFNLVNKKNIFRFLRENNWFCKLT